MTFFKENSTPGISKQANVTEVAEGGTRGRPVPDPIEEMATVDGDNEERRQFAPQLAEQPGPKPGFGPREGGEKLVGNPELGIDPREVPSSWVNGPKEGE